MMNIKELSKIVTATLLRKHIILTDRKRIAKKNTVNLNWWKMDGAKQNIGDYLSPVVFNYMKKINNIKDDSTTSSTKHLYAVGSIIDGGYQDATIWGSGSFRGQNKYWWNSFRKLDVRCVRGPKTREILLKNGYECPEIYGDPAVLMPLIYYPTVDKSYDYRIIKHYIYEYTSEYSLSPLTSNWKEFIDELLKSQLIISNSLHGIILAEAYGIPAILLKHDMNLFKYEDYYYSTGRKEFPIANSVEEALTITPAPLPDIQSLQKNLISSFPIDLWT